MKKLIIFAGAAILAACSGPKTDESKDTATEIEAPAEAMSLNETTWTFTMDGKQIQESIDASGNYIANAGAEHFDHGTYVLADGKQCFTSAMNDEGQDCWTTPATVEVGQSIEITSDKGEKMTVTRAEYVPMTMPS